MVVVACGDDEVAAWPLGDHGPVGLPLVDELARLQLAAGRFGCSIQLRGACDELVDLLDLVGLGDVVWTAVAALQVLGQAEGGEEVGVEEVVVPDDPVA
jgi:hypothetical protein